MPASETPLTVQIALSPLHECGLPLIVLALNMGLGFRLGNSHGNDPRFPWAAGFKDAGNDAEERDMEQTLLRCTLNP